MSAKSTTEQLDIEPTLLKGQDQIIRYDRFGVFLEAPLTVHLLLKHAREELCRLIRMWQAFAADKLLQELEVPTFTFLGALAANRLVEKSDPEAD